MRNAKSNKKTQDAHSRVPTFLLEIPIVRAQSLLYVVTWILRISEEATRHKDLYILTSCPVSVPHGLRVLK
jgi:hypothetical protein